MSGVCTSVQIEPRIKVFTKKEGEANESKGQAENPPVAVVANRGSNCKRKSQSNEIFDRTEHETPPRIPKLDCSLIKKICVRAPPLTCLAIRLGMGTVPKGRAQALRPVLE